jgi:hypothetical protein
MVEHEHYMNPLCPVEFIGLALNSSSLLLTMAQKCWLDIASVLAVTFRLWITFSKKDVIK